MRHCIRVWHAPSVSRPFVLKYRLAREENSPCKLEQHPREDASRALRIVRSRGVSGVSIRNGLA
jgi:hypothetical protein